MGKPKALGRGLSALISDESQISSSVQTVDESSILEVDINLVEPNRDQPRKHFNELALAELADSIRQYGILQPLIVTQNDDYYTIVAGERRWRAARLAELKLIPIIIKSLDALKSLQISLIENLQREDLNPIEEAMSYRKLIDEFSMRQEDISEQLGKSRSTIANALRILNLDNRVKNLVFENKLTAGHARAMLMIDNNDLQYETAKKTVEESLSVRQAEKYAKKVADSAYQNQTSTHALPQPDITIYRTIEKQLNMIFGTKVKLQNGKNKGKIEIEYYSDEDLDRIMSMMKRLEG